MGRGGDHILWLTGEGNGKPLQYSCLENPKNSMKRQKDRTLKDVLTRSVGTSTLLEISGEITPEKRTEEMEPKQKQDPVVDVTGDRSKVQCCKSNIA